MLYNIFFNSICVFACSALQNPFPHACHLARCSHVSSVNRHPGCPMRTRAAFTRRNGCPCRFSCKPSGFSCHCFCFSNQPDRLVPVCLCRQRDAAGPASFSHWHTRPPDAGQLRRSPRNMQPQHADTRPPRISSLRTGVSQPNTQKIRRRETRFSTYGHKKRDTAVSQSC